MERISALMDGELDGDETARLIPGVKERGELREAWDTYHLIGEALRGQPGNMTGIARTVVTRLAGEPTVLAPRRPPAGTFKRFALPSLAAAAAIASVTWISLETQQTPSSPPIAAIPASHLVLPVAMTSQGNALPEFAQATQPAPSQQPPAVLIQFPTRQIEAYLSAHQEFSPSTTMQGLAPYVRTVAVGAADTGR